MSDRVCPVTGEPLLPGEVLSRGGAARVRVATRGLPSLMSDCAYVMAHGTRSTASAGVTGYAGSRSPLNVALMLEVDEMAEAVRVWADELLRFVMGSQYVVRPGSWVMVARVFEVHEDRLRRWRLGAQCADEVLYSIRRLEGLIDPARSRREFVGKCSQCGADLLAREGVEEVRCRECGCVVSCGDAMVRMLESARGLVLPRPRATRVAEILVGAEVKDATVRSWCKRGHLSPVSATGVRLYRVGDIESLALAGLAGG